MPRFLKKKPQLILLILIMVLALVIYLGTRYTDKLSFVEDFIGEIVTPIQGFMYQTATKVSAFFSSFGERKLLKENYDELSLIVNELRKEQLEMNEIKRENERLKDLLNFKEERDDLTFIGARVTGKNPGVWFNTININRGSRHGVKLDMTVVIDKGLVGRVIEVGKSWSKVRTIVDGQSSVSGIVERTRDTGTVRGSNTLSSEDGLCRMIHLPLETDIVVGDRVITSGLGGIFPKGIYIGEIVKVLSKDHDSQVTLIIEPGVDFLRLEEVLVITSETN